MQDWAKKNIKARNSNKKVSVDLLRLLITGGAGVGKYYLMEICFRPHGSLGMLHNETKRLRDIIELCKDSKGNGALVFWSSLVLIDLKNFPFLQ